MRPGVPYTGNELAQYEDCVALVPAITLARHQDRGKDVFTMLTGMLSDAEDRGISNSLCWSILSSATLGWLAQMTAAVSAQHQEEPEDLLYRMISASVAWAQAG